MDNYKPREVFVKKILATIPSYIKPVDYLMEILKISRVSVYRRLNCLLPFTYDEIAILSSTLNISMDEILHLDAHDKVIFSFRIDRDLSPHDIFLKVLKDYYHNILAENKAKDRRAIIAINSVLLIHVLGSKDMFRFFYYKWLHLSFSTSMIYYLEDVVIPDEILEYKDKIIRELKSLSNTTFILDRHTFLNTIKEIQYYYRRKLINKKELYLLKEELEHIIEYAQQHILKGTHMGVTHYFFLSHLNIYSNSLYVEYADKFQSFFFEFGIHHIRTMNQGVCDVHKKWLESLKKISVLISTSNESAQMDFFSKQKKYLNNLINDKILDT